MENWCKESVLEKAKSCTLTSEFCKKFSGAAKYAKRHNFFDECRATFIPKFFWTYELAKQEALKYKTRSEFYKKSSAAAQWSTRNKRIDEVCSHMPTPVKWDLNSVAEEALKYSFREEFRVGSAGASQWATRNGVWDAVCAHMDLQSKSDYNAFYIWKVKNELDIYKFGVTSKRLGTKRIDYVSSRSGIDVEWFLLFTLDSPTKLESFALSCGIPVDFSGNFSGKTEFRQVSESELLLIISKAKEAST